ncbi:MAG: hypothetical protein ABSF96_05975 [Steroidobacteraceae bacterium]|jgi:hypothetical protein
MKRDIFLIAAILTLPIHADAEIYKLAVPSDQGLKLYWWPILPTISGWQHDEGASRANSVNALVPTGQAFSSAPAVIYAKAIYKPRAPQTKSLEQVISNDRAEFEARVPGVKIEELPLVHDGDGKSIRCLSFNPPGKGNWEIVAYSEEGDYYLLFTVSARTKEALQDARAAFERLVSHYTERH